MQGQEITLIINLKKVNQNKKEYNDYIKKDDQMYHNALFNIF